MILVIGTFRIPPENLALALPLAERVVHATRAEDGCIAYSYAQDLLDPGLIHVSEKWRDRAALDAHFKTAHMQAWITERASLALHDRAIRVFESDEGVAV
ncbi:putative quinol monooxygenase [Novosphingobium sp. Fuku2-ISO-50]|uniref:putative quinol monooxygenase n=1 Tax=Novosphingobium sp. Fuku2-ISO-50 TaxID=1739114 RepID=UPI00076C3004|nr:putative quinol monooxygenase [Novosphingobium sp. Fuku2-ISO-50]KUR80389.1 antibiotic biosynthesis monooxygenase [Novosphingobium sp. Fuku2-ISO-50]